MQFLLLVYLDPGRLEDVAPETLAAEMTTCLAHARAQREDGTLIDFRQLEAPARARSVRVRDGRAVVTDGPFAETKELLGGFNLVETESIEAAVALATALPWARYGCIEVRPVLGLEAITRRATGEVGLTFREN